MRRTLVLLAVFALGFAPAPLPRKPARAEEPPVHGDWEVDSWGYSPGGNSYRLYLVDKVRIVYRQLEASYQGKFQFRYSLTFELAASPPRVNLRDPESGEVMLGIYKVEGDTLTICHQDRGKGRPTDWHNSKQWMLVLKRKP